MSSRLKLATLALLVALPVYAAPSELAGTAGPSSEAAATASADLGTPVFTEPTIAGIQGNGFELGDRVAPDGTIYAHAPGALSSDTSWVWRSTDRGKTFKWVPNAKPYTGKYGACPGGGDTEMAVDSAGHIYFIDLTLVEFSANRSDDRGRTIAAESCSAVETTPNDRQWYATRGDPTSGGDLYLTYNHFAGGVPIGCPGGATVTANNELVMARSPLQGGGPSAGAQFAPSKRITDPCGEAIMGNNEVSPATARIFIIHPNAFRTSIRIARCMNVPFTTDPTGLSCVDKLVTNLPVSAPPGCTGNNCQGFKTGANFPSLAIDRAGNLFAIWQQAHVVACGTNCTGAGNVDGDTLLYWSSSTDEGDTWTAPVQIPTGDLHQNVFTWAAAGDAGRVDVAWYGSPAPTQGTRGPDSSPGLYHVFLTQTLNGTDPSPTFTGPIQATPHHVHNGTMFTLIGQQTGNRALGDFLQMRIGKHGEAIIAFGDSTNRNRLAHAMIVRQSGGTGVFASKTVTGGLGPFNSTKDPRGDASFSAEGVIHGYQANLDILSSKMSKPLPSNCTGNVPCYRVEMKVVDLSTLAPSGTLGNADTTLVWNTMWFAKSTTDPFGGKNLFVYMESIAGDPPTFWFGESARQRIGGGVAFTYPGRTELHGFVFQRDGPDTIRIDVPISLATVADMPDSHLHDVTASTMTLTGDAETPPYEPNTGLGGKLFNLIDVAPPYQFSG